MYNIQEPSNAFVHWQDKGSSYPSQSRTYTSPSNEKRVYSYPSPTHLQPRAIPEMKIVPNGGNRNSRNVPISDQGRRWSNGICGCFDNTNLCIKACICPCVVYAQNKQRLDYLNDQGIPDPEQGGGCYSYDCCLHVSLNAILGLGWVLQIMNRGNIRSRYQIRGSGTGDCLTSLCCFPCALTQERIELELEEKTVTT